MSVSDTADSATTKINESVDPIANSEPATANRTLKAAPDSTPESSSTESNPSVVPWRITDKPLGRFDSPAWKNFQWVINDSREEREANLSILTTGSDRDDYLEAERLGFAFRVPLGATVRLIERNHWDSKWFFEDVVVEVLEGAQKGNVGWIGLTDLERPMELPDASRIADYAERYSKWQSVRKALKVDAARKNVKESKTNAIVESRLRLTEMLIESKKGNATQVQ